jgi:WD40 repeat protein
MTPRRIGAFEIKRELGRGGIGTVLEGRDAAGRSVAIKVLIRATPEALARFERERRLLATLGAQGGFVPLLETGVCEVGPYLVMAFVRGGTLREHMDAKGALPLDSVLDLGRRIATALGHAHAEGIVHRDVKPENVLLEDGLPLVADLGLAKHFRDDVPGARGSVALTNTGELKGTVAYMAPEQIADPRAAGPPADVFALGLVLHECLAGHHPVEARTIVEMLERLGGGKIPSLGATVPDAPRWLVAAIDRACRKAPEERFEDGAAFAAALSGPPKRAVSARRAAIAGAVAGAAVLGLLAQARSRTTAAPGAAPSAGPSVVSSRTPLAPPEPPEDRESYSGLAASPRLVLARVLGSPRSKHPTPIEHIDVSANGKVAMTQSGEYRDLVVFWDVAAARSILDVEIGRYPHGVALAPDGSCAVIAKNGPSLVWCDLARGAVLSEVNLAGKIGKDEKLRACSDDGHTLLTFDDARPTVTVWNRETGDELWRLERVRDGATSALSAKGDRVLVARDDHVALVELPSGHEETLRTTPSTDVVALAPDGRRAILRDGESHTIWDAASHATLTFVVEGTTSKPRFREGSRTALFERAGGGLAVDLETGKTTTVARVPPLRVEANALQIRDPATGGVRAPILGHRGQVTAITYATSGELVTGSNDGTLLWWNPASGSSRETVGPWVARWKGERDPAVPAAVSADGRFVLTTREHTGPTELWDLSTGQVAESFGDASFVPAEFFHLPSSFLSDGKRFVMATKTLPGAEPRLALVDVATGAIRDVPCERGVKALGLGPEGLLVTGGEDGLTFEGVEPPGAMPMKVKAAGNVVAVSVSADGGLIASAEWEGSVRIWDARTNAPLGEVSLARANDFPTALAFSPDRSTLAVGTARGAVLLFRVLPGR